MKRTHNANNLPVMKLNHKLISTISTLNRVKSKVISKSNLFIHIIQLIATKKLSIIQKSIDTCENASKKREFEYEKLLKDYENIQLRESDLESFVQMINKNFSIFNDENETFESNPEIEELMNKTKLNSFKFSKNIQEIKEELQSNFGLFLEGHTFCVNSVTVTSDNKYILSGSADNTIRI